MIHYTTIEQSKKLVELGLNPDTADMAIVKDNTYCNALSAFNGVTLCQNYNEIKDKTNYIPCWSIGALWNLIHINCSGVDLISTPDKKCWIASDYPSYDTEYYNNALDAFYEMVCWLLENGYINTEKK